MSSERNRSNRPSTSEAAKRSSMCASETAVNVQPASPVPDPLSTEERIREAAYFLAARRGFTPGHELEDWLAAERALRGASGEPYATNAAVRDDGPQPKDLPPLPPRSR
jgi:hypothetical protein